MPDLTFYKMNNIFDNLEFFDLFNESKLHFLNPLTCLKETT